MKNELTTWSYPFNFAGMVEMLFFPLREYRFFSLLIFGFLCFLLSGTTLTLPAAASESPFVNLTAEEREWLDNNPDKLTLFYNIEFPPVEFRSGDGKFVGIGADVVGNIEKILGVNFIEIPSDDWNHHLASLESGACAIAPTIVDTVERERFTLFTAPYATTPVVIIGPQSLGSNLTLDDLENKRVAVVSGFASEGFVREEARDRFTVVQMTDVSQALRATAFGQVDAYVENLAVAAYYIDLEGISNLKVAGNTSYSFPFSIGVSKKYPLLFSSINKALETIPENELEAVRNKWISLQMHKGLSPGMRRNLIIAALFVSLLLLGLAFISFFLKRSLNEKVQNLKQAQEKILEQAELLSLAVEATRAGIWDYYPDRRAGYFSEQWFGMLGYEPVGKELSYTEISEFIHPDDQPSVRKAFNDYFKSGDPDGFECEFRLRCADGSWFWVFSRGRAVAWDEKNAPVRIIGLDISIQTIKEARELVVQSESRFRAIFEHAPYAIVINSLDGKYLDANRAFLESRGIEKSELSTYTVDGFAQINGEHKADVVDELIRTGSVWNKDVTVRGPDGTIIHSLYSSVLLDIEGEKQVLSITVDITERKQAEAEKRKLQEQLMQSQKLEAVGILAGGVAHDFNNMLGAIIGYAELTLSELESSDPMRERLGKILESAERSASLTRQLLAFARKQAVEPVVFDLNESVKDMLKMLHRLIGEDIDLENQPATERCLVNMDPSQFDQILANLCVNARDAIKDVGKIIIKTDIETFDETSCKYLNDCSPGDYVMLSVSDNGCGMDSDTMKHVFEPFFTTKGLGRGTGLGLATVYGVVKQSGGFINVYSEPGIGTTFNIYLPNHKADAVAKKIEPSDRIPTSLGETILIVEDDPILRDMGIQMLRKLEYNVLSASGPGEAIRMAKKNDEPIDLLLTDVVMPEMNGRELFEQFQKIRPRIKHLFMSGYTADVIVHRGVLDKGVNFIQKPFTYKSLAIKIRNILG